MQISVIDREAYVIPEGQRVQPGSRKMRNHERYRPFELHTGKLVIELTSTAYWLVHCPGLHFCVLLILLRACLTHELRQGELHCFG